MSTTIIVALVSLGLFILYIAYNYRKMAKMENVPPSDKIVNLNNKNFKPVTRLGIVLIDFWAPWCGPCKMVAPVLNDIAESEADKVKVAKVNVDQNQALAQKFKVRNIPTLVFMKNGREVKRLVGYKPKKAIMNEVNKLAG